jgi:hypothetical protein
MPQKETARDGRFWVNQANNFKAQFSGTSFIKEFRWKLNGFIKQVEMIIFLFAFFESYYANQILAYDDKMKAVVEEIIWDQAKNQVNYHLQNL